MKKIYFCSLEGGTVDIILAFVPNFSFLVQTACWCKLAKILKLFRFVRQFWINIRIDFVLSFYLFVESFRLSPWMPSSRVEWAFERTARSSSSLSIHPPLMMPDKEALSGASLQGPSVQKGPPPAYLGPQGAFPSSSSTPPVLTLLHLYYYYY